MPCRCTSPARNGPASSSFIELGVLQPRTRCMRRASPGRIWSATAACACSSAVRCPQFGSGLACRIAGVPATMLLNSRIRSRNSASMFCPCFGVTCASSPAKNSMIDQSCSVLLSYSSAATKLSVKQRTTSCGWTASAGAGCAGGAASWACPTRSCRLLCASWWACERAAWGSPWLLCSFQRGSRPCCLQAHL